MLIAVLHLLTVHWVTAPHENNPLTPSISWLEDVNYSRVIELIYKLESIADVMSDIRSGFHWRYRIGAWCMSRCIGRALTKDLSISYWYRYFDWCIDWCIGDALIGVLVLYLLVHWWCIGCCIDALMMYLLVHWWCIDKSSAVVYKTGCSVTRVARMRTCRSFTDSWKFFFNQQVGC